MLTDTCYANQKLTIVMMDAFEDLSALPFGINPSKRVILFLQNVLLFSFITEFFPFVFSAASLFFGINFAICATFKAGARVPFVASHRKSLMKQRTKCKMRAGLGCC